MKFQQLPPHLITRLKYGRADIGRQPEVKIAVTKLEVEITLSEKSWRSDSVDYPPPTHTHLVMLDARVIEIGLQAQSVQLLFPFPVLVAAILMFGSQSTSGNVG